MEREYVVKVTSRFTEETELDWVETDATGLKLLLRRVCGASLSQCKEFLGELETTFPHSFDGLKGQENLSYILTANHRACSHGNFNPMR